MNALNLFREHINRYFYRYVILTVFVKLSLMLLFSSELQERLFYPFVSYFTHNWENPWDYFHKQSLLDMFPYHPIMLYVLTPFAWIAETLFSGYKSIQHFLFKVPILLADLLILNTLIKIFQGKRVLILFLYFLSPIVLYAAFVHSQLDLIPMAIAFVSVYWGMRSRIILSGILLGIAAATKLNTIVIFPLILLFLWKSREIKQAFIYGAALIVTYLIITLPYIGSLGFQSMVLSNPKQSEILSTTFTIGNSTIYLAILAVFVLYMRFMLYRKVNYDLLYTYIASVFSVFILLVEPGPGWYLWMLPFLAYFHIKNFNDRPAMVYLYAILFIMYLNYFLFAHHGDYSQLYFLMQPLMLPEYPPVFRNISFTLLFGAVAGNIYVFYKFGILSNSIYKSPESVVIGIGGDSGSGKTTLREDLKLILGKRVLELEGDADHKWERGHPKWNELTHLDPKANFLHKQAADLLRLKQGRYIFRGDYDHSTGHFSMPGLVRSNEFIILSGLHPFYLEKLRRLIDIKIFMDPEETLRREWKISRDMRKRGYSADAILAQMESRSQDSIKFIAPQKKFADLIVRYFKREDSVGLELILKADYPFDAVAQRLEAANVHFEWDFLEDLSNQNFIFTAPVDRSLLDEIFENEIRNVHDLFGYNIPWQGGYRGIVQLFILIMIAHHLEERS